MQEIFARVPDQNYPGSTPDRKNAICLDNELKFSEQSFKRESSYS
jgi:hypothetical protein